jgi:protein O-GlcNAc transferase
LLEGLLSAEGGNADGWYLLAAANHRLGLKEQAIAAYEKLLALDPRRAEAHYYLGNLHGERGDHQAAAACYRQAVELDPQSAAAARNLGATLQYLQRPGEAVECYGRFLQRGQPTADILQNLGNALSDIGAAGKAIEAYRAALRLDSGRVALYVRLGNLLEETGALEEALAHYRRALALDPQWVPAWRCLAAALAEQGHTEEALDCYRRSATTNDAGLRLREATLLPVIARSAQEIREWRARYEAGLARLEHDGLQLQDPPAEAGCPTFFLAYHGEGNRALNARLARLHERACPTLTWTAPHCRSARRRDGRLRVGFISRFFYAHSIAKTTRGLVERLSRQEFEPITLFVPPLRDDEMARRIRAAGERTITLPDTLEAARAAIAELELDVLFYQDIGMDPFSYFLAYSRLAPVQCTSFGHPDTTGIGAMDYFVSSDRFEPPEGSEHYSEQLFLLRGLGTLAYYYRPQLLQGKREDFGLPAGAPLYLCPQTLFKFHPDFDALLGGILRADADGRVVLIDGVARDRLQARLAAALPDVAERILVLPRQSGEAFSRLVGACDVMLDTLHFNGMNTSLEAFAAGTPVVTLPSEFQRGRHTAGMYRRLQIDEAVARDAEDYVRIAVALGRERDRREALSAKIRERSDALFEDVQVVREFERFFREALSPRR